MEKERKIKVLSIVALIVAVLGLTVAFAALSQTLTINGTAKVEKNYDEETGKYRWNVRFYGADAEGNLDDSATTVTPTVTDDSLNVVANLSSTTINIGDGNTPITLKKPGDKAVYTFYVKNNGSINACLAEITDAFKCGTKSESDKAFCNNVTASLTYADGDNKEIKAGDKLAAGTSKKLELTFEFSNDATSLPTDDIILFNKDNGGLALTYVQD